MSHYEVIVIGGGAAGFFTAINAAAKNPELSICILERGSDVLGKVKVSGGGRCNVTHAEFMPRELTANYPRGEKELLGPFHSFMTGDTIAWFEERGVDLKIEEDGRMFPISDSSQTIIDCFLTEVERLNISVKKNHAVKALRKRDGMWQLRTSQGDFSCDKLVVATGSSPKMWKLLEEIGHTIVPPVPSLFTFNSKDARIEDLSGVATEASVKVLLETPDKLEATGALLITHWGMSGPAILKLSAWGARLLEPTGYNFTIQVKTVSKNAQWGLPKRLWKRLVAAAGISEEETWAHVTQQQLATLQGQLTEAQFEVKGKSTFKEEFVTAGGILLKEIDFKRFESKVHANLFLVGEVLNIDAITGGFNFQNAWTGGYLAARAIAESAG